jgi:long-chain acyl-CoA synthetase
MRGYWDAPEATAKRYRPGPIPGERVCHTGDLFRMDEEGYLYFVARKDDIIKSRGEKVAPKEVENVIYGLKGVREVAVIGVPDPMLGEAVKAFIVAEDVEMTEADVLKHCRAHLEDLMTPKYIEFCQELPKTSSGKIKKTDLK